MRVFGTRPLVEAHHDYGIMRDAFINYKSGLTLPSIIGRDVSYNRPQSALTAGLHHIHLKEPGSNWLPFMKQDQRTSDTHLIYCQHYYVKDAFLLIAVLAPNAHEQGRRTSIMARLAEVAENFHGQDLTS